MANVSGNLQVVTNFGLTPAVLPLLNQKLIVPFTGILNFANGTLADQSDLVGYKLFSFVPSTMQTCDLTAMSGVDGNNVNLARVNILLSACLSTTDGASMTFAPDAANGWSLGPWGAGSYKLLASSAVNPNGGIYIQGAPNTTGYLVDGTHKVIDATPSAHTFTGVLIAIGRSV